MNITSVPRHRRPSTVPSYSMCPRDSLTDSRLPCMVPSPADFHMEYQHMQEPGRSADGTSYLLHRFCPQGEYSQSIGSIQTSGENKQLY